MVTRVKVQIQVEFETRDEQAANSCVVRIGGDLKHVIQEGKMGHAMTGVIPGSVQIEILNKSIS